MLSVFPGAFVKLAQIETVVMAVIISARRSKCRDGGFQLKCRFYRVLIVRQQQLQNAAFCRESFVFTSDIQKCPAFSEWAGPQIFFKASKMNKVCASSNKYPHIEKIKNVREQNFKGEANNKQLDNQDTQQGDFSSQYLSLTLVWNILIPSFVFARIGPYCNTKPESLFLER